MSSRTSGCSPRTARRLPGLAVTRPAADASGKRPRMYTGIRLRRAEAAPQDGAPPDAAAPADAAQADGDGSWEFPRGIRGRSRRTGRTAPMPAVSLPGPVPVQCRSNVTRAGKLQSSRSERIRSNRSNVSNQILGQRENDQEQTARPPGRQGPGPLSVSDLKMTGHTGPHWTTCGNARLPIGPPIGPPLDRPVAAAGVSPHGEHSSQIASRRPGADRRLDLGPWPYR